MDSTVIRILSRMNPNMSDIDRLTHLYHGLSQTLSFDVPGDVVELGCHKGFTSILFRLLLDSYVAEKNLHVYDSFEGLPSPGSFDRYLKEGDCKASEEELYNLFQSWNLRPPIVHRGWFKDTLPKCLPNRISFAYIDSDFYDSVLISLETIYSKLSQNGVVFIDDYSDTARNPYACKDLPGPKLACDCFFADKPEKIDVLVGSNDLAMAYFRKV